MEDQTRLELEAAAFRRLVEHLRAHPDVQNIDLTKSDAVALDCVEEVAHALKIVARGTSAHRQIEVYEEALEEGADKREALIAVVDFLIEETLVGID